MIIKVKYIFFKFSEQFVVEFKGFFFFFWILKFDNNVKINIFKRVVFDISLI